MRPRPSLVSLSLVVLALVHAFWGARMVANGNLFMAASQLVSAGGLLLAAVSVDSRHTFGTALGITAIATGVRMFALLPPGPFFGATALLAAGFGAAAWAARRLDAPSPPGWTPLAFRGGFVLAACGYLTFLGLSIGLGGASPAASDFVVRAIAAILVAIFLDAPPAVLARERKGFAGDTPIRAP